MTAPKTLAPVGSHRFWPTAASGPAKPSLACANRGDSCQAKAGGVSARTNGEKRQQEPQPAKAEQRRAAAGRESYRRAISSPPLISSARTDRLLRSGGATDVAPRMQHCRS